VLAQRHLLESGQTADYDGPSGPIESRSNAMLPSFATYEIRRAQADGTIAQIDASVVALD